MKRLIIPPICSDIMSSTIAKYYLHGLQYSLMHPRQLDFPKLPEVGKNRERK